jgi:hypothetical protein
MGMAGVWVDLEMAEGMGEHGGEWVSMAGVWVSI